MGKAEQPDAIPFYIHVLSRMQILPPTALTHTKPDCSLSLAIIVSALPVAVTGRVLELVAAPDHTELERVFQFMPSATVMHSESNRDDAD